MRLGKEGENYRLIHEAGKRPKDWLDNVGGGGGVVQESTQIICKKDILYAEVQS